MNKSKWISVIDRILLLFSFFWFVGVVFSMRLDTERLSLLIFFISLPFLPAFYWLYYRSFKHKLELNISLPDACFEIDKILYSRSRLQMKDLRVRSTQIYLLIFILIFVHFLLVEFNISTLRFYYFELIPLFISYRIITNYYKFKNL